jgi:predicted nucleotidyltransferase
LQGRRRGLGELSLPGRVRRILQELPGKLRERLGEAEVYLFGSYARGDWLEDSDIDLIVVSPAFRGRSLGERYRLVRELLPPDVSVEVLAYTPEEFRRALKRSSLLREASRYWVRLA